jgi:tRNA threonylcarbamoyl adenosine modification protein (Sua5/YciO/YrdC/YwlC family)
MLIRLYEKNMDAKSLDRVVAALRDGALIAYPTDTVYAFGCDALNVRAVERICRLKGIDPEKSNLSIVCHDLSNIADYARVSNPVFKLMKRNLPGPFTFILNATGGLPKIYKKRKEVGIRVPDNPITLAIVEALGNPLLSTSVRDRDDIVEYCSDASLIEEEYGDNIDMVIDGGYGGLEPSTVIDCTGDEPVIVRQGKGDLKAG